MNTVRWGIIGCGAVTEVKSGPAFNKVESSALVAVMRRNFLQAKDYATRHHAKYYYDDADKLIHNDQVDAIYIATPPSTHKEYALKVASAGKPCCIEKPMALNYTECNEILAAFSIPKIPLFVAYYRRSLPRFIKIKNWIDTDAIGDVRHVHWSFSKPLNRYNLERRANWRTDPTIAGAGYFMDLASHGINLFEFLIGEIKTAQGITTKQQGLYKAEDAVSVCWQFENGGLGSGYWSFSASNREDTVEIIGSKGNIKFSVFNDQPISLTNFGISKKRIDCTS